MARKKPLGNQLRKAIADSGRTGADLSESTGLSESTFSRFLRGHIEMKAESIELIADELGYDVILKKRGRKK